jgi:hypothetical protein
MVKLDITDQISSFQFQHFQKYKMRFTKKYLKQT